MGHKATHRRLGEDQILQAGRARRPSPGAIRIQFTGNARRRSDRGLGFTNGVVGTIQNIDGVRVTVELDGKKNGKPRMVSFTVGDNSQAGQFNSFRHGYAGTIYKGQGRTLDRTYLYHLKHLRSSSSHVALTRHRETTAVFVARETAGDLDQLARQMARVDDRRAASQFHREPDRVDERSERQRKIDAVVQQMREQRERSLRERDRDR